MDILRNVFGSGVQHHPQALRIQSKMGNDIYFHVDPGDEGLDRCEYRADLSPSLMLKIKAGVYRMPEITRECGLRLQSRPAKMREVLSFVNSSWQYGEDTPWSPDDESVPRLAAYLKKVLDRMPRAIDEDRVDDMFGRRNEYLDPARVDSLDPYSLKCLKALCGPNMGRTIWSYRMDDVVRGARDSFIYVSNIRAHFFWERLEESYGGDFPRDVLDYFYSKL